MLYSFCRTSFSVRGVTLPWQLVDAHEPGPVYFPAASYAEPCVCAEIVDAKIAHAKIAAAGSRNQRENVVSGVVFMSRLARLLYLNFSAHQSANAVADVPYGLVGAQDCYAGQTFSAISRHLPKPVISSEVTGLVVPSRPSRDIRARSRGISFRRRPRR